MSKNRLQNIVSKLQLVKNDKKDLVNIINNNNTQKGEVKNNLITGDEYSVDDNEYLIETDYDKFVPNIKKYLNNAFKYGIFGHLEFSYQLDGGNVTILPFTQCHIKREDEQAIINGNIDNVKNDIHLMFGVAKEIFPNITPISIYILYEANTKKFKMQLYEV